MPEKKISVEDWVEIANLIGKYQWLIDDGDESWADLFVQDGAFLSEAGEGYRGHEALKNAALMIRDFGGMMRHSPGALWIEYGATPDEAFARFYNLVTTWEKEPAFFNMALCKAHLVRIDGDWKIKTNTMKGLSRSL